MELVSIIKTCLNETCSKIRIGKHLTDVFPIQISLKQDDVYRNCFPMVQTENN